MCCGGMQSAFKVRLPTISIRNDSARNRTIGACIKAPYKQRMTSSTRLFSCELDVLAPSPELSFLSIVRDCERTFQMLAGTNRWKGTKAYSDLSTGVKSLGL
jgi:hypothetical protein